MALPTFLDIESDSVKLRVHDIKWNLKVSSKLSALGKINRMPADLSSARTLPL